jgi:hypothetical protein
LDYLTDTDSYLSVTSAAPSSDAYDAALWTRADGAEYEEFGLSPHCPFAFLDGAHSINAGVLNYRSGSGVDSVVVGGYLVVGGEYMRVDEIDTTAETVTVSPGVLDTVPKAHSDSEVIYFADGYTASDDVLYAQTEVVMVKLQTRTSGGDLDVNMAPEDSVTMAARQARPYPPGQLRINGEEYPTSTAGPGITVAWAHRDRLQQTATIIDQGAGSIGPEAGTTYSVRAYENSTLIDSATGISGTSRSITLVYTPSLLHFNGTNTSTTFSDETGKTWTASGNAQISTAQSMFGGASGLFDGSGDYITSSTSAEFVLGDRNITLECWIRPANTSAGLRGIASDTLYPSAGGWALYQNGTALELWRGGAQIVNATGALTASVWQHVAWSRQGSTHRLFVDGVLVGSGTDAIVFTNNQVQIGRTSAGSYFFNGHIDEFRLYNGAIYTSAFTVPPEPFIVAGFIASLLHLNGTNGSTTITDAAGKTWTVGGGAVISTAQSMFGGASVAFSSEMTANYLSTPHHVDHTFGTGDFTVEYWVRHTSFAAGISGTNQCHIGKGLSNWSVLVGASGQILWYAGATLATSSSNMSLNTWHHVAIARQGSTLRMFLDGAQVASFTNTTNYSGTDTLAVGSSLPGSYGYMAGYVDEVRISKGVAHYTAAFTPPAAAFTFVAPPSVSRNLTVELESVRGALTSWTKHSHTFAVT